MISTTETKKKGLPNIFYAWGSFALFTIIATLVLN
jgi:hypothetical protein